MNLSPRYLIKLLEQNGLFSSGQKAHIIFTKILKNITVIVPLHGNKDLAKGTYLAILKQAGIENK